MPKKVRGGKRNNLLNNSVVKLDSIYGKPVENGFYVGSDGSKHFDGEDGWRLTFGTHTQQEIDNAEWLQDIVKENVYLNPKVEHPEGVKSCDYVTESGVRIENKGPTKAGKDKIERLVNQGKEQSDFILVDITGQNYSKKEIERQVNNALYKNNSRRYVNQIIIKDNNKLIGWYKKRDSH